MKGFLYVVDGVTGEMLGALASLDECRTEAQVVRLIEKLQDQLGHDLEVRDSRKAADEEIAHLNPATGLSEKMRARNQVLEQQDFALWIRDTWRRLLRI